MHILWLNYFHLLIRSQFLTPSVFSLMAPIQLGFLWHLVLPREVPRTQGSNFIAAIAVEGEQNAVDYCGNDGNFLPYSIIFTLFTVHYYFDTWIQMLIKLCINYYFSLSFLRKKNTKEIRKHVSSLSTIQSNNKTKFLLQYCNLKKCRGNCQNCRRQLLRYTAIFNAIAVDWFQGNSRPARTVTVRTLCQRPARRCQRGYQVLFIRRRCKALADLNKL
jgi:hypothetical protein